MLFHSLRCIVVPVNLLMLCFRSYWKIHILSLVMKLMSGSFVSCFFISDQMFFSVVLSSVHFPYIFFSCLIQHTFIDCLFVCVTMSVIIPEHSGVSPSLQFHYFTELFVQFLQTLFGRNVYFLHYVPVFLKVICSTSIQKKITWRSEMLSLNPFP